jgi:hypothetical protein
MAATHHRDRVSEKLLDAFLYVANAIPASQSARSSADFFDEIAITLPPGRYLGKVPKWRQLLRHTTKGAGRDR